MYRKDLIALLALQAAPGIGAILAKRLISNCGSAEAVFKEKKHLLNKISRISPKILDRLDKKSLFLKAENELKYLEQNRFHHWAFHDDDYPRLLKHCADSPLVLFGRGQICIDDRPIVAVVGTRNATAKGLAFSKSIIEEIAPFNPIIVSGFATGIDICAQKSALENGLQTIGCLAHGLDDCYPKQHKKYCEDVEKNGGFVTDFWRKSLLSRGNFLSRNRIIAGMVSATIVVESAEKGGALITAQMALDYNREVFAVPGHPHDKKSVGCNLLIKQQKAQLIGSGADLAYWMGWDLKHNTETKNAPKLFVSLSEDEKKVVSILEKDQREHLDV